MTLSEQVCTLEQAKRLKELGIKAECLFYWVTKYTKEGALIPADHVERVWDKLNLSYPAYTVAELGELLPDRFITSKSNEKYDRQKGAYYVSSQMQAECPRTYAPTEAQSRAAMLIYLIENGIIKPIPATP